MWFVEIVFISTMESGSVLFVFCIKSRVVRVYVSVRYFLGVFILGVGMVGGR